MLVNFQPTFRLSSIMAKRPEGPLEAGRCGPRQADSQSLRLSLPLTAKVALRRTMESPPGHSEPKAPDSKVDKITKQVINLDSVMVAIVKESIPIMLKR